MIWRLYNYFLSAASAVVLLAGCASRDGDDGKDSQPGVSDASPASKSIVVYYANETPDSDAVAARLDRLDMLLSQAWQQVPAGASQVQHRAMIDKHRQFIKQDRVEFPAQVAKDIRGLEKQICLNAAYRTGTSLFVFSNKLARSGKFQFCSAGASPSPLETGSWPLALVESSIMAGKAGAPAFASFKDSPLIFTPAMRAARDIVQSTLTASVPGTVPFKLTFIVKSHSFGGKVVTSRHPIDNGDVASVEGAGSAFIQAVIGSGALPEPQNAGMTESEFRDEIKSLPFPLELLVFDHANTPFDPATGTALREDFSQIRSSIFTPSGQGAGYEGLAWGNLPPAVGFAASVRQILKSR
jgi:hypothetical protein